MHYRRIVGLIVLALLLISGLSCYSPLNYPSFVILRSVGHQSVPTGIVTITLVDYKGTSLGGYQVHVRSLDRKTEYSEITNVEGRARFNAVAKDTAYRVYVSIFGKKKPYALGTFTFNDETDINIYASLPMSECNPGECF